MLAREQVRLAISRLNRNISTNDLIRMAGFALKNNYFQFNKQVKQQISATAIGTKFAPVYVCLFMDDVESKFLTTQPSGLH